MRGEGERREKKRKNLFVVPLICPFWGGEEKGEDESGFSSRNPVHTVLSLEGRRGTEKRKKNSAP